VNEDKIIRGQNGKVWVGGKRLSEVKSVEAKLTFTYEDVALNGEMAMASRLMGSKGTGKLVMHKVRSWGAQFVEDYQKGICESIKITASLEDPTNGGVERVEIQGVKFDGFGFGFENQKLEEEELSFRFTKLKYLDKIK